MWGRRRRARHGHAAERPGAPPAPGGWPERLQFLAVVAVFALCWSAVFQRMQGRISFAWVGELQQQVQTLTAPLQSRPAAAADRPLVTGRQSPQVAEAVPTAAAPTATALPLAPLVLTPAATPSPEPTATPEDQTAATATPPTRERAAQPTATTAAMPDAALARAGATATAGALPAGPHLIYVIQHGDTLYGIARRYGLAPGVLAEFNHLQPPYRLAQGGRLLIPES